MKKRYASFALTSALLVSMALAPMLSFAANTPPSTSGVSSPTVLHIGETGTWTVSASDRGNGPLTYSVNWGDQTGSPLVADATDFVQTATFTHSYASAGTYTVRFMVKDTDGLSNSASVTVHVIGTTPPTALQISNVDTILQNQTHVVITWTTNIRSTSRVFYSTGTPVDVATAQSASGDSGVVNHRVELNGLSAGTRYHFVVRSRDDAGEIVTSPESSFTTPINQNLTPTISSFSGPATIVVGTQGTWTVNASDPRNGSLSYAVNWGDESLLGRVFAFIAPQVFTQTTTFTHIYSSGGTHTITITARNDAGLTATAHTTVFVTTTNPSEPVLSNVSVTGVGQTQAILSWNSDENANSSVWIGTSAPNTANSPTGSDSAMVTNHSLTVQNLSANTTYFAIVGSRDAAGNLSTSSVVSFTTSATATPPTISSITALVSEHAITFNWNTNESADTTLYYSTGSPVVIGGSNTATVSDATRVTDHMAYVTNLTANTTYHFILQSKDASGAVTITPEFSVTTMSM